MDSRARQAIINGISQTLIMGHPFTIMYKNRAFATILPVEDDQKFQTERDQSLKDLKKELNSILDLIHSHTGHQSLAEVEAQLAALRHDIEQEMGQ